MARASTLELEQERRELELSEREELVGVMSPTLTGEVKNFLAKVSLGVGKLTAALGVGWTPEKLDKLMRDQSFLELYEAARELDLESIEEMCRVRARRGNMTAIQLVLYSFGAHRGWKPPAQRVAVSTTGHVRLEVVESTRQAIVDVLEATPARLLQIGGPLDQIGPGDGSANDPAP